MSNRGRAGLIVLAVVIVAVAFIALRPSDSSDKADDPAGNAGYYVNRARRGRRRTPTATAESAPPPPKEVTLRDGIPQGGVQRIEVKKGDEVRLQVRTNEATADEIHLHGYDIEKEVSAGRAGQLPFQGGHRGRLRDREPHRRGRGPEPLIARLVVEPS